LPLATSATGNVKSRKESKQISPYEAESNALRNESTMRKVAQPLPVVSSGKRQRILTPAAAKVSTRKTNTNLSIDEEGVVAGTEKSPEWN
jgi:hypothetical protein